MIGRVFATESQSDPGDQAKRPGRNVLTSELCNDVHCGRASRRVAERDPGPSGVRCSAGCERRGPTWGVQARAGREGRQVWRRSGSRRWRRPRGADRTAPRGAIRPRRGRSASPSETGRPLHRSSRAGKPGLARLAGALPSSSAPSSSAPRSAGPPQRGSPAPCHPPTPGDPCGAGRFRAYSHHSPGRPARRVLCGPLLRQARCSVTALWIVLTSLAFSGAAPPGKANRRRL
jgi:hypothetical protein